MAGKVLLSGVAGKLGKANRAKAYEARLNNSCIIAIMRLYLRNCPREGGGGRKDYLEIISALYCR